MKKLTDEEMTKALECCICSTSRNDCEKLNCPACKEIGCYFMNRSTEYYPESLIQEIGKSVLDLINRQKAENERLKDELYRAKVEISKFYEQADAYCNEAIDVFADSLKIKLNRMIDNLVQEMTEVNEDE